MKLKIGVMSMEKKLCEYGCGQEATHQLKNGKWICNKSWSLCPIIKEKNSKATCKAHKDGRIPGWSKQWKNGTIKSWSKGLILQKEEDIFKDYSEFSSGYVKKALLFYKIKEYKCEMCGITSWNKKCIVLELNHINGNNRDNRLDNLEFLCPNCHSQTNFWRGRGINTGKTKITDEQYIEALKTTKSIRQALIKVGLAAKGTNYTRAKILYLNSILFENI